MTTFSNPSSPHDEPPLAPQVHSNVLTNYLKTAVFTSWDELKGIWSGIADPASEDCLAKSLIDHVVSGARSSLFIANIFLTCCAHDTTPFHETPPTQTELALFGLLNDTGLDRPSSISNTGSMAVVSIPAESDCGQRRSAAFTSALLFCLE